MKKRSFSYYLFKFIDFLDDSLCYLYENPIKFLLLFVSLIFYLIVRRASHIVEKQEQLDSILNKYCEPYYVKEHSLKRVINDEKESRTFYELTCVSEKGEERRLFVKDELLSSLYEFYK